MTVEEALSALLGTRRTGDRRKDLILAAREALARRERNSVYGGVVLAALHDEEDMTYDEIQRATGINRATAQRWAVPPQTGELSL